MKRRFVHGARPTIGFQINNLYSSYGMMVWHGVTDFAEKQDCNLLLLPGEMPNSPYDFDYQHNIVYNFINRKNMDALVMASGTLCNFITPEEFKSFYSRYLEVPVISMGLQLENIPSVIVDNKKGMTDLMEHFIQDHGFKHIAFIRGPEINLEAEERYSVYCEMIRKSGLPFDEKLVVKGNFSPASGIKAIEELLDVRKVKIDAVIAANDDMAMGAMDELRRRNIKIPDEVAIGGFDDTEMSRLLALPMTTVKQPFYEQAWKATELAYGILKGDEAPLLTVLPTEFMVRASCGCLSQSLKMIHFNPNPSGNGKEKKGKLPANSIDRLYESIKPHIQKSMVNQEEILVWMTHFINIVSMEESSSEQVDHFNRQLHDFLVYDMAHKTDAGIWQNILSELYNYIQSYVISSNHFRSGEYVIQLSRIITAEMMQLQEGLIRAEAIRNITKMINTQHHLISTLHLEELMQAVSGELTWMGIPSYYMILYEKEFSTIRELNLKMPDKAKLMLACRDNEQIQVKEEIYDISEHLIPLEYLSTKRFSLIAETLFFREEQFGFIVFEATMFGPPDSLLYDIIRTQISSILKSSMLLIERQKAEVELIEKNQKIQEANAKMQELDRVKTNFFSNISHELRTPLTLMLGPLESIITGDFGESFLHNDERFISMLNNGFRLLKLINNLLDFSKLDAGKMQLKKSRTDIVELLKIYAATVRSSIEYRQQKLVFDNQTDGLVAIIDRDILEKAVFNLISNAVKFTPEGGTITISLSKTDASFSISVSDTGIGIPQDKLSSIFERFIQLDTSSSKKYQGTGIGLAFTKDLVELHQGKITVQSKVDKGSVFTITLPFLDMEGVTNDTPGDALLDINEYLIADIQAGTKIKKEEIPAPPPEKEVKTGKSGSRRLILVVEDNIDMQKFMTDLLSPKFNVVTANNGLTGIEKAKMLKPSLILSDVMMPEMDGYEMTRRLKSSEETKSIPIILVTAKADVTMKIAGLEFGADDYLYKPFNSRELFVRINNLMKNKELQEQLILRQREVESDLAQAALVQQTILTPKTSYLSIASLDIDVRYIPMNQTISGDYYNITELKNGLASIMIADAAGHGIQAALSTMQIDLLNKESLRIKYPDERLEYINKILTERLMSKNFFTCFLINIMSDRIYYSCAAHPKQYLIRTKTREIIPLKTHGKIIGMLPDCTYEMRDELIAAGDVLFLFTDGIEEEFNPRGSEFGEENLVQFLKEEVWEAETNLIRPSADINTRLLKRLEAFKQGTPNNDDITMICVRIS